MQKIYITEPKAINLTLVSKILPPDEYEIIQGVANFLEDTTNTDLEDCSIMAIRSATTITPDVRRIFPNVQHIIRVGTGVDNIDIDFCNAQGIAVYNAPGANASAVSDYVISMMFYALRNVHQLSDHDIKTWNRFKFTGHNMSSRSIGIIGFGNIGKQIFSKLQGFNCQGFFVYDPFIAKEDMPEGVTYSASVDDILRQSDVVTLHVPLLPTTKYLINKNNLGLLPKHAILINASRGGIVNETDVVDFVRDHADRAVTYIADTVEGEPQVSEALLESPSIIITPHIASLTLEAEDTMVEMALDNFLSHKPMNSPR